MRDEDDPIKRMRKIPHVIFDGIKDELDIRIITDIQNKLYMAEDCYDKVYEELLEHYQAIIKKL